MPKASLWGNPRPFKWARAKPIYPYSLCEDPVEGVAACPTGMPLACERGCSNTTKNENGPESFNA